MIIKKILPLFVGLLTTTMVHAQNNEPLIEANGLVITEQMLIDEINSNPNERKDYLLASAKNLNEYIDIYYREKLLENIALQQKMDESQAYQALLKAAKRRLLVTMFVADKKRNMVIPDMSQAAKEYYQVNKQQFRIAEQVEARHILLKSKPDNPDKAKVKKRLEVILAKLKKDPSQFQALAKKNSEDSSASKGGDLGKISKGRTVPEFEREAFKLTAPNQLSPVFSTKFGFHIIQLIEKHPSYIGSFEQAKPQIMAKLEKDYADAEYMRWRNEIVDPKKAKINQKKLQEFVETMLNKTP